MEQQVPLSFFSQMKDTSDSGGKLHKQFIIQSRTIQEMFLWPQQQMKQDVKWPYFSNPSYEDANLLANLICNTL